MSDDSPSPEDTLFKEGMKYDWRQGESPEAATLARACFQQAAAMGHKEALRALAHLVFDGRGGTQNKEQALLLLWSAFNRGDRAALEELGDLLASYAEQLEDNADAKAANNIAETLISLNTSLVRVSNYMQKLARIS